MAAMQKYLDDGLRQVDHELARPGAPLFRRLMGAMDAWFGRHLATFAPDSFDVIDAGRHLAGGEIERHPGRIPRRGWRRRWPTRTSSGARATRARRGRSRRRSSPAVSPGRKAGLAREVPQIDGRVRAGVLSDRGAPAAMNTVLVTGGSGFVGAHCLVQLLSAGHRVRTTVRSLAREADVRARVKQGGAEPDERLAFFAADLERNAGWAEAVAGCDYVLHVASPFPAGVPKHEDELIVPAREGTLRVPARRARRRRAACRGDLVLRGRRLRSPAAGGAVR